MRLILLALIILLLTACERPVSSAQPYRGQNPFTPEAVAHLCAAADLQTSSSTHEEAGEIALGITLINRSQTPCNLQASPQITLKNSDQTLDVEIIQTKADASTLSISAGESIILVMNWRNYCGAALKGGPDIHLALTGGESLTLKTQLAAFPRCENADAPSTLTVNPYSYPP